MYVFKVFSVNFVCVKYQLWTANMDGYEKMKIEVDGTKHEITLDNNVCNDIEVEVNIKVALFYFYCVY